MSTATPRASVRTTSFVLHAIAALGAVWLLDGMIVFYVPFEIEVIKSSYLIFFYHLPAALNCFRMLIRL